MYATPENDQVMVLYSRDNGMEDESSQQLQNKKPDAEDHTAQKAVDKACG